jgi:X-Pro dipeptidyl-peptidase-like protein
MCRVRPTSPLRVAAVLMALAALGASRARGVDYEARKAMVPMRDGAKLRTLILRPKGVSGPLPILLRRTPYDARGGAADVAENGYLKPLADDDYQPWSRARRSDDTNVASLSLSAHGGPWVGRICARSGRHAVVRYELWRFARWCVIGLVAPPFAPHGPAFLRSHTQRFEREANINT